MRKDFKSNLQNRAVSRALAQWRKESGLSLVEVSDRVHWSTAKSSMMQNALVPVTEHDVLALALAYGITDEQRRPVLLGAQRALAPRQFELLGGDPSACVGWTYAEMEAEARYARVVALDVLPPIVRTPEYEAALRAVGVAAASTKDHRHYGGEHRSRVMDHLSHGPTSLWEKRFCVAPSGERWSCLTSCFSWPRSPSCRACGRSSYRTR